MNSDLTNKDPKNLPQNLPPPEPKSAFAQFEEERWDVVAETYHQHFGNQTRQTLETLLDSVEAEAGVSLLDVACGQGFLVGRATVRGCIASGVDISAEMIAIARKQNPESRFRRESGEALSYADNHFDTVACNFGMPHFDQPELAIQEAQRVLKRNGRYGFTVWQPPEHSEMFALFMNAVQKHGDPRVELPPGPPPHQYANPEHIRSTLAEFGFKDVQISELPVLARFQDPHDLLRVFTDGGVRSWLLLEKQDPKKREAISKAIIHEAGKYTREDGTIGVLMPALMTVARKA